MRMRMKKRQKIQRQIQRQRQRQDIPQHAESPNWISTNQQSLLMRMRMRRQKYKDKDKHTKTKTKTRNTMSMLSPPIGFQPINSPLIPPFNTWSPPPPP